MNKDELFRHVATMGHKATNFPQPARPVNDMHREGFERWAKAEGFNTKRDRHLKEEYAETATHFAFVGWCAALRYRDEQEKQA